MSPHEFALASLPASHRLEVVQSDMLSWLKPKRAGLARALLFQATLFRSSGKKPAITCTLIAQHDPNGSLCCARILGRGIWRYLIERTIGRRRHIAGACVRLGHWRAARLGL